MSSSCIDDCVMMQEPNCLERDRAWLMAIVNVTPDSFYDVSRNVDAEAVIRRVEEAVAEGADIVDIGGYSSRPGAKSINTEEEWRRVELGLKAVERLHSDVVVSIDTFRSEIVDRAYKGYGRFIVNDISAGELDERMIDVVAEHRLGYVAMHMRGTPQDMQQRCNYDRGVVTEVVEYFDNRVEELVRRGVERDAIVVDPGFGFSKTVEQNWELLSSLDILSKRYRVLAGVSRKSMIYKPLGLEAKDVLPATLALGWEALRRGAQVLRVHDVGATRQLVDMYNYVKHIADDRG